MIGTRISKPELRIFFLALCILFLKASLEASLTAWWTFDSDYSSEVNNDLYQGIPIGEPFTSITNQDGEYVRGAGGLKLDNGPGSGNRNYVIIDNEVFPDGAQVFTIVAWYKYEDITPTGSDSRNSIWETVPSFSASFGLRLNNDRRDAEWFYELASGGNLNNDDGPIVNDGQWHHVAMVWNRTDRIIKYYHDGRLRDASPLAADVPDLKPTARLNIGNHRLGNGTRDWDGFIDDFAVFDQALTSSQVAALYSGDATPLDIDQVSEAPPPVETPAFVPGTWTLVIIPDIQKYTQDAVFIQVLTNMMEWIRDHKTERNIVLALQEGDITDDNDDDGGIQWMRAKSALSILDGHIPYVLATGNHDYGPGGNASTRDTLLNEYFTPVDNPLNDTDQDGILAGLKVPGELQNAYYDFTAPDGKKFLIFSLEWGPRDETVEWANSIVGQEQYKEHMAVLVTHSYLWSENQRHNWAVFGDDDQSGNPHSYRTDSLPGGVNDGQELWDKLVKLHANFKLTFNGHTARASLGSERTGASFLTSIGDNGNFVHQMLFNAQHVGGNGGGGWIRLIEFTPGGRIQVKTISPYLESIGENPWRTAHYDQFSFILEDPLQGSHNRLPNTVDWIFSPWFGFYNISFFPWIFHEDFGFNYFFPDSTPEGIFLYDPVVSDWLFTVETHFPDLYFFDGQGWMRFIAESESNRQYFRYLDEEMVVYQKSE